MLFNLTDIKKTILLFLMALATTGFAQAPYGYTIISTPAGCVNATARLEITGTIPADTVTIDWNAGYSNTQVIYDLTGGAYSVHIKIKHKTDSVPFIKDTTLVFTIDQEECIVYVEKYFSPNGDNYNDFLVIANSEKYPAFELSVYNKWGQRVHYQHGKYTPWDGTWLGLDLPDGTYYYVFFYDAANHNRLLKGDITIIR